MLKKIDLHRTIRDLNSSYLKNPYFDLAIYVPSSALRVHVAVNTKSKIEGRASVGSPMGNLIGLFVLNKTKEDEDNE